jgi:hypothetical protein
LEGGFQAGPKIVIGAQLPKAPKHLQRRREQIVGEDLSGNQTLPDCQKEEVESEDVVFDSR